MQSQLELALSRCHRLGSPFVRGSFTGDGITASQRFPVRERYILAYREFPQFASCILVTVVMSAAIGAVPFPFTAKVSVHHTTPQPEQVLLLGYHWSASTMRVPYQLALYWIWSSKQVKVICIGGQGNCLCLSADIY